VKDGKMIIVTHGDQGVAYFQVRPSCIFYPENIPEDFKKDVELQQNYYSRVCRVMERHFEGIIHANGCFVLGTNEKLDGNGWFTTGIVPSAKLEESAQKTYEQMNGFVLWKKIIKRWKKDIIVEMQKQQVERRDMEEKYKVQE
jgi:hypothetical protein